jgi:hypothetical protein
MGLGGFNAAEATKNLQKLAQKTGKGPLAAPAPGYGVRAPSPAFSPHLQQTFRPLGRQVGAPSKLASPARQQQVKMEEPGTQGKFLGLIPEPWRESSQAQNKEFEKRPKELGIALPAGLPGLQFLLGADVAAKGVNTAVGSVSGKSLPGKLYNEALQIGMGGPRASVEAIEHPVAFAKGMGQLITHPVEHPLGALLTFGGLARAGDVGLGKLAKVSTDRAPGTVGGVDQTEVPRSYSQGLVENAIQKGVTKAKEAAAVNPDVLRTRSLPLYGSKVRKAIIGGIVKPGLTDIHRGNENVVGDLQAAKAHEFVEANRPANVLRDTGVLSRAQAKGDVGLAHDEAMMPFHEGYARRPETYWEDISKREGRLLLERKGLSDQTALDRNQQQINQLRLVKEHQESINKVGLDFHEAAARKLGDSQSHSFYQELLEGHLHPDQFNARLMGFGLEHGDLLGRGQLQYVKEPGKDPIVARVGELKKALSDARKRTQDAKEKLAKAAGEAKREKMRAPAGLKAGGLKIPDHYTSMLDERQAIETDLRRQVQEGLKEIAHRKTNGYMDSQGNSWHGLYDGNGERVPGKELRELYAKETNGREPGFITHKEEGVPVAKGEYVGGGARPGAALRSRTGEHAMSGNYRNDFGTLHREFRRSARNLSKYRSENQLIEQFGVQAHVLDGIDRNLPPDAQKAQLVELARELNGDPGKRAQAVKRELGEWVVVSRGPDRVLNSENIHDSRFSTENQVGRAEGKATLEKPGELKYTLIRKGVLDRLESQVAAEKPTSPILKAMKRVTGYQRHVALYSSPRWPVGVTQENMIRLAAQNTSPFVALSRRLAESSRAFKAGRGYLEGLNKTAGSDLRNVEADPNANVPMKTMARTNAGLLEHGSMIGSEVRSLLDGGRAVNQDLIDQLPPTFADNVVGTVGVKQGLDAWERWKEFLGNHLSNMENRTRIGLAGHQLIKDYGPFSTEVKGLIAKEDTIVKQVVADKLDPVEATRFTEQLLDAAGNWSHLTPLTREMRTWFAPFGLWWLNSAKFMFKTMPLDHPLKTALWAALVSATKPDKRPEFKQGSIHVNMPWIGPVDFSPIHYSTADIFHEWEKTAQGMVMPWFTEALERSAGINPLYQQSVYANEEQEGKGPANVKGAAEGGLETFLPFGNIATSLIRRGGSPNEKGPFPSLEAKAGTEKGLGKTLAKFATPFPFTYSSKAKGKASGLERVAPERGSVERVKPEKVKPER